MFVSYAQNFEDVMLWRALRSVDQGFFIDLGAFDPIEDSVTLAFHERGWTGINVEPTEAGFARMAAGRPDDINLRVAIGRQDGELPFYTVAGTGLSTTDPAQAEAHRGAGWHVSRSVVPVVTLAALCRDHVRGPVHFLKIDVEGAEQAVLEGADFAACRPWIILLEATLPLQRTCNHAAWEGILLAAEYRFVWFDGLNRFYVAAEKLDALGPCFDAPPNVFDGFVRATELTRPTLPGRPGRPAPLSEEERAAMTARCRDADAVPKVPDAGLVWRRDDGTVVQRMHNGLEMLAGGYCGDWMTRLIVRCRGHHEPQEERLFHAVLSHLPPGGTMIELGGWWAFYSLWFLRSGAGRRAIVLEPDPAHMAVGMRNARLNGLQPEFVSGFVGRTARPAEPFATEDSGVIPLRRFSVPQLMAEGGLSRVDILHCDTQGAEVGVLESCAGLFRDGRVGWVFVSTHAMQITGDPLTHQRCLALLRDAGAAIEAEHDVHESFSGDGLIVARFGPAPEGWVPVELSRNRYSDSLFPNPLYDVADRS